MDKNTNKEISLAEALSKIETLSADNGKLSSHLEAANLRMKELETKFSYEENAHASTKETLSVLQNKHRDMDKEVAEKVASIAAQSGVEPIKTPQNNDEEESIDELAKRIDSAQGIEKAKLIEANAERISAYLKGVSK